MTLDGAALADLPFDFTKKGMLGMKKKGTGQVKRVVLAPSGRHTVGAQLVGTEEGNLGSAEITKVLPAGSDWTLRVDLPEGASEASFYLVKSR